MADGLEVFSIVFEHGSKSLTGSSAGCPAAPVQQTAAALDQAGFDSGNVNSNNSHSLHMIRH